MRNNLLLPFQTSPGTLWLWADPEAACHVFLLLQEACEEGVAEKPLALQRFGPLTMHPIIVAFQIKFVSEGLFTGLTLMVGCSFLLPWLITYCHLRLDWNQQVALISGQFDHILTSVQVDKLQIL